MKDSARALLREMPIEAVRAAYGEGVDVWAVYCRRHVNQFQWETVKRAGIVLAVLLGALCTGALIIGGIALANKEAINKAERSAMAQCERTVLSAGPRR
mgnify:CR=1 FL=1